METPRFTVEERQLLEGLKGLGRTVVTRPEEVGLGSLELLSQSRIPEAVAAVPPHLSASCWRNSPQAKKAIESAIALAQEMQGQSTKE